MDDNGIKRHKICINLHDKDQGLIEKYSDNITCSDLIELANEFIKYVNLSFSKLHFIFNYIELQKTFNTEQFGINIAFRECSMTPETFANEILKGIGTSFDVFSYQYTKDSSSPTNNTSKFYLTENKSLIDNYRGIEWSVNMDSFTQCYPKQGEEIHKIVNGMVDSKFDLFVGIGGEMGYYAKANKDKFLNCKI
jgi:hypothetical protein